MGCCFIFILLVIILGPLVVFSGLNPLYHNNPIKSATLKANLLIKDNSNNNAYYFQLYLSDSAQIRNINKTDFNDYNKDSIFVGYTYDQIQMIDFTY